VAAVGAVLQDAVTDPRAPACGYGAVEARSGPRWAWRAAAERSARRTSSSWWCYPTAAQACGAAVRSPGVAASGSAPLS
jgi:hypothetical protein